MEIIQKIKERAKQKPVKLVFPEGTEKRLIQAARTVMDEKIAQKVTLLGPEKEILGHADKWGISLDGISLVDPENDEDFEKYAEIFAEKRKKKNLSIEDARSMIKEPIYYAALMVDTGRAGGSVGGAVYSTGKVIVAAAQVLGMAPGVKTLSSSFLMVVPDFLDTGCEKAFVYGDAGAIPNPNSEQLASIAKSCANMYLTLTGEPAKVAMLSFSTKGSGRHPDVEKVTEAVSIARKSFPELDLDGELQLDAAIIPDIGKRKAPGSRVAGYANTLVFPDLDAGNIGYKLTERLAKAKAVGPLLQGCAKPFMDLSRGCSDEDIVNVSAITCALAAEV